jgi:hypothetical protein
MEKNSDMWRRNGSKFPNLPSRRERKDIRNKMCVLKYVLLRDIHGRLESGFYAWRGIIGKREFFLLMYWT